MAKVALRAFDSLHLNVARTGNGPPIVAIHGFTGNLSTWDSFSEAARRNYSVIRLDLPGHGMSDAPENPAEYGMENTMRVLAELLDKLNVPRVHWLGYSMGGRLALAAAFLLEERTLSVTLESASPGLATADKRAERIRKDEELADKIETMGIEAFVNYWETLPLWSSQGALSEEIRQNLRLQRLANNPAGLANSLRGIGTGAQPSFHQLLPELRSPTLLIAGAEDKKFSGIAREMHRAIKNSSLCIVAGSRHMVHQEQPLRFNRIVLDFLRKFKDSGTREALTRSRPNP